MTHVREDMASAYCRRNPPWCWGSRLSIWKNVIRQASNKPGMHIGTDCRNVNHVRAIDCVGKGIDQGRHFCPRRLEFSRTGPVEVYRQ